MITLLKCLFRNLHNFIRWHNPHAVSTMSTLEKHLNLSTEEIAMLEACIDHKLLKEYVWFTEDKTEAYIVLKIQDVKKLVNLRRKNVPYDPGRI